MVESLLLSHLIETHNEHHAQILILGSIFNTGEDNASKHTSPHNLQDDGKKEVVSNYSFLTGFRYLNFCNMQKKLV